MTENKLCIADQIGNYIKYTFDKLEFHYDGQADRSLTKAMEFCKEIRGDIVINGQNPRGIAAGIVYIACYIVDWELFTEGKRPYKFRSKPMILVADILNITEATVRKYSHMIRRHFKLG